MRLLIVGTLKGQLTTATKIAMDNGASVTHADSNEQAMAVLRGGKGADLLLVDGNPLQNIELIKDPAKNFLIIMKDGKIYKNLVADK